MPHGPNEPEDSCERNAAELKRAHAVLLRLSECVAELEEMNFLMAAANISTALDSLRTEMAERGS
jgi:hypothetical protein